jgi:hypothetical protein
MNDLGELIANAVTLRLSSIKDDNQALRLALLAVLALTEDGGEIPETFREYLICHFRPLVPYWKDNAAPFTEDYKVIRAKDAEGRFRLLLPETFARSTIPH